MKRWSVAAGVLTMLASLGIARTASANVASVKLFAGRLKTPESCFVQVDVVVDEQNLQNGAEELLVVGHSSFGTWASLVAASSNIGAGKSVLYGSSLFAMEAGITPDIEVPGTTCAELAPKAVLDFKGSFGPIAGTLTIPDEFSELAVVGELLLIHLENEEYKLKSLGAEKTIGPFASGSSSSGGATSGSSSGSSSGATSSGGSSSGTGSGSAVAPSSSDDGSCSVATVARTPRGFGGAFVAFGFALGLALAAVLRRRGRA